MRKQRTFLSFLASLLVLALALTMFAQVLPVEAEAVTKAEVDEAKKEVNELKEQNKELQQQIKDLRKQINANLSEIEKMVAEKDVIDQEIGILNLQILNVEAQIAAYGLLIADKQDELDEARKRLEDLQLQNKARIRAMEEEGELSYWSVLFRANSFADLLDRLQMIQEIAAADKRRLKEMSEAADLVEQTQKELETEKLSMEDARNELEVAQTELELKRVEADEILVKLNATGEAYARLMSEAEDSEQNLLMQIAAAEKEYNKLNKQYEEQQRPVVSHGQKPPATITNGLTWLMPCNYYVLSSPYGPRVDPVYGGQAYHHGVDLAGPKGTPIYATRAGTVTMATYAWDAGYYVTVNHGDGFSSSYLHMTNFVVSAGQQVKAGQLLGYMGSTGKSTGPHLHFAIYYNGASQNPAQYIKFY